jgi:hypothetical protein
MNDLERFNPTLTDSDKPGKSKRRKAKTLSNDARREMTRYIIDTGLQNEFAFPLQPSSLKPEPINKKRRRT